VEGTETAIFTILANANYEVGTPASVTITIKDDDSLDSSIGTTTATTPPNNVSVGEELQAAVTWTVPSGGWRQLTSIELRLRDLDDPDAFTLLSFDEATGAFSVAQSAAAAARYGPVSLVPAKSTFSAAGPTAPTVTVTFVFRFSAAAAKHRFAVEVAATNDTGAFSGFSRVGDLHVHKVDKKDKKLFD
jgi:hypothetical protein